MPEHESVYDFLTGRQFVELAARLPAVESVERTVRTAIETVGLVDAQNRRLRGYSRRMRLAATLERDGGNFDPGRRPWLTDTASGGSGPAFPPDSRAASARRAGSRS